MQTLIRLILFSLLILLLLSCHCNAEEMEMEAKTGVAVAKEPLERGLEGEMAMDSEADRRVLWGNYPKRYISYAALRGDAVPCSRPGVPYYNCGAMSRANPYSRSCEIITLCAREFSP